MAEFFKYVYCLAIIFHLRGRNVYSCWCARAAGGSCNDGLDAFNYLVAEYVVRFYQVFRKLHTGVFSWNMILIMLGATLILILLVLF